MIGREAELLALEEAVRDRAERPVALVAGEAGVGKTRLVRELRERQLAAGATVAVGSCVELGADLLPYAPFVESLGRLVEDLGEGADELLGAARPDLAILLPGLSPGTDPATGGGGSRGRMYEAVRAVLDRGPDPLVLLLEDVHWADRSTLELLDYLARRLRHGRTLLLATYRTDELHRRHPLPPVLAELARAGRSTRIEVGPLDGAQSARLVRELGVDAEAVAVVDAIARRSEGNPFLLEELIAAGVGEAKPIPGTLRELLLARVGSVDASTRRALGIVAALGRPAEAELVELAWNGSGADLDGALRDAVDRGLLVVNPGDGRRLAFRHALLAEAVVDDLLPGERVRLHATLARILADAPGPGQRDAGRRRRRARPPLPRVSRSAGCARGGRSRGRRGGRCTRVRRGAHAVRARARAVRTRAGCRERAHRQSTSDPARPGRRGELPRRRCRAP